MRKDLLRPNLVINLLHTKRKASELGIFVKDAELLCKLKIFNRSAIRPWIIYNCIIEYSR